MKKKDTPKNILIVGSGAIGLLWYSHLYLGSKNNITTHLYQSTNRNKLPSLIHFTDLHNKTHRIPSLVFTQASEEKSSNIINNKLTINKLTKNNGQSSTFDIILVCVKSYQLNQAIIELKPLIMPNTILITSHNGLGPLNEENTKFLSNKNVWNLLTTHGSLKSTSSDITHTGKGMCDLGIQFGTPSNKIIKCTTQLLNSVLPKVEWCNNLPEKQWTKLAINCVINPITALFDINNGEVTDVKFETIIQQMLDEVIQISLLQGIHLNKEVLIATVMKVANKTKNNSSSMRCDIIEKRTTEIKYINGYIHRLGIKHGVKTQKNTELYQQILALSAV